MSEKIVLMEACPHCHKQWYYHGDADYICCPKCRRYHWRGGMKPKKDAN